jgi:ATP-dependent DNA helicase RecG
MENNTLTIEDYRLNVLKMIHFAIKEDYKYFNQVKNIEITLYKILTNIREVIKDEFIAKQLKKFEFDLQSYNFASMENKKKILSELYDFLKDKNFSSSSKTKIIKENSKSEKPIDTSKIDMKIFFKKVNDLPFLSKSEIENLNKKNIFTIMDILYTLPKKYEDWSKVNDIDSSLVDEETQFVGVVKSKRYVTGRRKYMEILFATQSGTLRIILFNYKQIGFLYKVDSDYMLRGKLQYNTYYKYHLIHPKVIVLNGKEPITQYLDTSLRYPDTGVSEERFLEIVMSVLDGYKEKFADFIPFQFLKENNYLPFYENMMVLHKPDLEKISLSELNNRTSIYHDRLKFEEFFLLHLSNLLKKNTIKRKKGIVIDIDFSLHQFFIKSLPFELTNGQLGSISDLFEDLRGKYPANRLIQGDVGSGKTIVAISALLQVVKAGYQAIIMVPTEILAYQHQKTLTEILEPFNVQVQLFVSKMKKRVKDTVLMQMEYGAPQIFIGTHALIQKNVRYKNPGIVIVDEQHRFGVLQRKTLQDVAKGVNVLLMSATPIPRTLSMGVFGDLDISYIEEMPKSRKPVKTLIIEDEEDKLNDMFHFLKLEIEANKQAYIIFPLIEESDSIEARSLLKNYEELSQKYFKDIETAFLHGKLSSDEKEDVMNRFKKNEIKVLFSTTVIEVGIDVQNATIMIIMNSERFGLSQLHQIRGRIGRGVDKSYCFLVSPKEDVKRLKIMEKNKSGFEISREDLKLRGPGDLYGVDQSGIPKFRFIDFDKDEDIILTSSQAANRYIKYDPNFKKNTFLKEFLELLKENSYWDIS